MAQQHIMVGKKREGLTLFNIMLVGICVKIYPTKKMLMMVLYCVPSSPMSASKFPRRAVAISGSFELVT